MKVNGRVSSRHGEIAYCDQAADGPETGVPVLFVHGNSTHSHVFERQFSAPVARSRRFISFDLPGHGKSEDAPDPVLTYGIDGFADAALVVLKALKIKEAVIVGWSLGGHIALELAAGWSGARAVLITGTPPVAGNAEDMTAAFAQTESMGLTFKRDLTEDEILIKARGTLGENVPLEDWLLDAVRRADGRFRPQMVEAAMSGRSRNQREIVKTLAVPLAVLHGGEDPFVNLSFLQSLAYRNLWRGEVQVCPGIEHAPFWECPESFNEMLAAFLDEVG